MTTPRAINDAGLRIVEVSESLRLVAYWDPNGRCWTIGYGSTTDVYPGMVINHAQAATRLHRDLFGAESAVQRLVRVPLNDNQFSALVDLVFNIGAGNLQHSALLAVLNEGRYSEVPEHMLRFDRSGGHILPGLQKRREADVALWNTKEVETNADI